MDHAAEADDQLWLAAVYLLGDPSFLFSTYLRQFNFKARR
jgi:hypothetical protein